MSFTPALPDPVYRDDAVTLYHGDAEQILPLLPRADLLLTDPPYGIGIAKRGQIGKGGKQHKPKDWDAAPPPAWLIEMAVSRARQAIVWGGAYLGLGRATCSLVWDKKNDGMSFSQAELAWTNLPSKAVRMFRFRQNGAATEAGHKEVKIHPTQKPVPLMAWCIEKVKGCRSIIDPFAGSCATLVAARAMGITAIGIERDLDYCKLAVARLRTRDPFLN